MTVIALIILPLASQARSDVLIEQYGDSTTEGWQVVDGRGSVTAMNAPAILEGMMQDRFGPDVRVNNHGVGATQSSQLWDGTDGRHVAWHQRMAESPADIVTLNFGLNDAYYAAVADGMHEAHGPSEFAETIAKMVESAKAHGKKVILLEPHQVCEPTRAAALDAYVLELRKIAHRKEVPIVSHYDVPMEAGGLPDCLHPSDDLYRQKAEREFSVIAPLVQRSMIDRQADRLSATAAKDTPALSE